ncbi:vacuolar fusion protein MON1 homolog B isoform X2 [Alligator mississippiensis]|uniref:vacuolar fusion protein MON1 homolog B isoform X2 n=1 Tax=Alligator mississippiensis TaxID=8496 RepID=UPI002877D94E|nr:vacuolar fusion protein MON1 homolog B isoform X2 [Alligator mississippiensis]
MGMATGEEMAPTLGPEELSAGLEEAAPGSIPSPSPGASRGVEEAGGPGWRARRKHVFVLSEAGKPIYSRYGSEEALSATMGVMTALVSFVESGHDAIRSICSEDRKLVFEQQGPLVLVSVSRTRQSEGQLRRELLAVHGQILSVLTRGAIARLFQRRQGYDLRRLLAGSERLLDGLLGQLESDAGFLLGAVRCLPLAPGLRDALGALLQKATAPNLVLSLLLAGPGWGETGVVEGKGGQGVMERQAGQDKEGGIQQEGHREPVLQGGSRDGELREGVRQGSREESQQGIPREGKLKEEPQQGVAREGLQVGVLSEGVQEGGFSKWTQQGALGKRVQQGVLREEPQLVQREGGQQEVSRQGEVSEGSQLGVPREGFQLGLQRQDSQLGDPKEGSQPGLPRQDPQPGAPREGLQPGPLRLDSHLGRPREGPRSRGAPPGQLQLVAAAQERAVLEECRLHPSDLQLLLNLVGASAGGQAGEMWTPVCLPRFNPDGYFYAYVARLEAEGRVCLTLLSTDREAFYAAAACRRRIEEGLRAHGCLPGLVGALRTPAYGVGAVGLPELRHFIYKPLDIPDNYRQLPQFTSRIHSSSRPLRLIYHVAERETLLAWVTSKFELYTCFSPLVTKAGAINILTKLLRWIKKEEDRLFIRYPPKYSTTPHSAKGTKAARPDGAENGFFSGL